MDLKPTKQGTVPLQIKTIEKECITSYKIFGDLSSEKRPLIAIHGGPGSGHEYLLPFAQLWPRYGIPVVLYDQVGCGASTHLKEYEGDAKVWNEDTFLTELKTLVGRLELSEKGFDILGHSWGGMLAMAYAALHPKGLNRLIIASSPGTVNLYVSAIAKQVEQFPPELRKAVEEGHRDGVYDTPEYKAAADLFLRRHFYRPEPFPPPELEPRMKHQKENPTAYRSMFGPSGMMCTGLLKDWSILDRLGKIEVPVFTYNAEFDTASDEAVVPLFEGLKKVKWRTFNGGGHMCHLEGKLREEVLGAVGGFLVEGR